MKVAFYLNVVSPHQLPLAREIIRLIGEENFRYVYAEDFLTDRKAMGWNDSDVPNWCVKGDENTPELMDADLVYTGIRCLELMAKRAALGKKTAYYSERWFKPIPAFGMLLPGWLRMVSPGYRKMARQMVAQLNNPLVKYLPCGPWAANDLERIGLKESQMMAWGYFVECSRSMGEVSSHSQLAQSSTLKILWVGRMIGWKRVDTIVRAVRMISKIQGCDVHLSLVGDGDKRHELERLAVDLPVEFLPSQPIEQIRQIMRANDVYVLSSNAQEGWGAAANEALEEGMKVLGTFEAGASAAMLNGEDLYHAGDWQALSMLLIRCSLEKHAGELKGQGIGQWTAKKAAERLIGLLG